MNITENQMGTMKVALRIMNTQDKNFFYFHTVLVRMKK